MLVPVAVVGRVAVAVVRVVDVIAVGDRHVAAAVGVLVRMLPMGLVILGFALVHMVVVKRVKVAVVRVVDVIAVGNGNVAAAGTMGMGMVCVDCHRGPSWECVMASFTMWLTWASTSW